MDYRRFQISVLSWLALLAISGISSHALAVTRGPVPQSQVATPTGQAAALEEENHKLRYDRDVAQIRADLLAAQTNWFAILISALIGFFSLVVAGVVIFFTLRFGKAAVAEAKQGIAAEVKEIRAMLDDARKIMARIEGHEQSLIEKLAGLAPGETPTDEADRTALRDIALGAQSKPRGERTPDDYSALVMVAAMDKDWLAMERRAGAMAYLFEDADLESQCFALISRGYALGELGRSVEELAAYDDVVNRFGASDAPALREYVAQALVNKGNRLGHGDALAAYDEVERRFGASDAPALREQVAKALFNKGVRLGEAGRHDDALAAYAEVERRFGASDAPAMREYVAKALFNKACVCAQLDRVTDCIAALSQWRDRTDRLDCDQIARDSDFDTIRERPTFRAFLKANGCGPAVPGQPGE